MFFRIKFHINLVDLDDLHLQSPKERLQVMGIL
jgi:hypothetical protein